MLFNSYVFIFVFLPLAMAGFYLLGRIGLARWAFGWLALASLLYYGWWDFRYLVLFAASIFFNYGLGRILARESLYGRRALLVLGIAVNLGALGYFKYAMFAVETTNALFGTGFNVGTIVLPIGISFFTFQQIAYLVDVARGTTRDASIIDYALFVSFFPQLIAGPIVHHSEMMPQFAGRGAFRLDSDRVAVGLTLLIIGLFKKTVIADTVALYSSPVFDGIAARNWDPTFIEAWRAALAYTLQIYFDFSAYSDMALGLGRLFGIALPLNFNSPYKASSIADFWRRWHMTLSRFLRDFLYVPLGGNRRGAVRRYVNLFLTMLLGGIWHGAGWTYVVWGALHGILLTINHLYRAFLRAAPWLAGPLSSLPVRMLCRPLTFVCVVAGWVVFRARDLSCAGMILRRMFLIDGLVLPRGAAGFWGLAGRAAEALSVKVVPARAHFEADGRAWPIILGLLLVAWLFPNTQQMFSAFNPAVTPTEPFRSPIRILNIRWRPGLAWAILIAVMGLWSLLSLTQVSEFLYFQF